MKKNMVGKSFNVGRGLAVVALVALCTGGKVNAIPDSVAMIVGGKPVLLADFLFIAQKNGEADLSSLEALHEYVALYKNFRLKVAEAEDQGIDTTEAFRKELGEYRGQLEVSYLSDKPAEDKVLRSAYALGNELLEFSYLLFRFQGERILRKDTAEAFDAATEVHKRLLAGETIDDIGTELTKEGSQKVIYEYVTSLPPFRALKDLDDVIFTLPTGALSHPIRTSYGYYIVHMHRRHLHPGRVQVAHILAGLTVDTVTRTPKEARTEAEAIYARLLAGEDFGELAKQFSTDAVSARNGGVLPPFGPNEMIPAFEQAAFSLNEAEELSGIVESRFGFHIIRLIEKLPRASFENERASLEYRLSRTEHNFELHKAFDSRMKQEYGYIFYPDAYATLEDLCDEVFPSEKAFGEMADSLNLDQPLFSVAGLAVSQKEFARFMASQPLSSKTYAPEYMQEAYDIFVHELLTNMERQNLKLKHPEYGFLLQEYRDGILLFEVSNKEIWTKPVKQQEKLEKKWLKKLNKKFSVEINWDVINRQVRN
ncbi:MAG: peptidylprolyl isomerase [Tannerellaceae bacterium]|jgi:peptidyl-prolyl cis-trans isomerase SurA|nr:peptidylprolyl isomerase [Tannerellaceae bacterium]